MKTKSMICLGVVLLAGFLATYALAQKFTVPAVPTVHCEIKQTASGNRLVQFRGQVDARYYVQSSEDLKSWHAVSDELVGGAGWTKWVDTRPAAEGQRFYRVVPAYASGLSARRALTVTEQLLAALKTGDNATVISILRARGVSETTLAILSSNLGRPARRAALAETFLKANFPMDRGLNTALEGRRAKAANLGFGRIYWRANTLETNWPVAADARIAACNVPPIGVLNVRLTDANLIELFKWYDRYAERLHSVVVNGDDLLNSQVKPDKYAAADDTLAGLFKLVKARKPEAFVWVAVERRDDATDVTWLKALSFRPDGLQVFNLTQFHSAFATTRANYLPVVGADTALMVAGFYGYKSELRTYGDAFKKAERLQLQTETQLAALRVRAATSQTNLDSTITATQAALDQKQAEVAQRLAGLGAAGRALRTNVQREAEQLQTQGWRGLGLHWQVLQALNEAER